MVISTHTRRFEDGAHQQGEVGLLGGREEGRCDVDGGQEAVVPWHLGGTSFEGWSGGNSILFRGGSSFQNLLGGYASDLDGLLT